MDACQDHVSLNLIKHSVCFLEHKKLYPLSTGCIKEWIQVRFNYAELLFS